MRYPLKVALKSLWLERWINLLSILSIGVGLFILGFVGFILYNVEGLTKGAPERLTITVFLKDEIPRTDIQRVIDSVKKRAFVKSVRFISKEEALEELKEALRESAYLVEGIDENPLFASLVIRLKGDGLNKKDLDAFLASLRKEKIVDEVIFGEEVMNKLLGVITNVKIGVVVVGLLFCVAIVFICYSTVKMLFYRRKEEVEIYKLLGATKGFIRSPFLFEGLLLGLGGGIIASIGNLLVSKFLEELSNPTLPFMRYVVMPEEIVILLPLIGMTLGVVGSAIALGKIRY